MKIAVGDASGTTGWLGELNFEIDSGSDIVSIPRPFLEKLFGQELSFESAASMETADGNQTQVAMTKISLRLKTVNEEIVILHDVDCAVPDDGTPLLGRNVLNMFKITLVQGKMQSIYLNPKIRSWLGLSD